MIDVLNLYFLNYFIVNTMFMHNQAAFNQGSYFISNLDRAFAPNLA
jgi:hypothetical protein